jgi:hypothetical protein
VEAINLLVRFAGNGIGNAGHATWELGRADSRTDSSGGAGGFGSIGTPRVAGVGTVAAQ